MASDEMAAARATYTQTVHGFTAVVYTTHCVVDCVDFYLNKRSAAPWLPIIHLSMFEPLGSLVKMKQKTANENE